MRSSFVIVLLILACIFTLPATARAQDADSDGLSDATETSTYFTDPNDADTDNDGITDGAEVAYGYSPRDADYDNDGLSDGAEHGILSPMVADFDSDGLTDGQEAGRSAAIPGGTSDGGATSVSYLGTAAGWAPDSNPGSRSDPADSDSDNDGLSDGQEDRDRDGNLDVTEPNPVDADTDNDGRADGAEDIDHDGNLDQNETHPLDPDTDDDALSDGLEMGVVFGLPGGLSQGPSAFQVAFFGTAVYFTPDTDPGSTTNPRLADTDTDGLNDGVEDADHDGVVDFDGTETDPADADTDGDGLSDGLEILGLGTNPLTADSDGDGIWDINELSGGANVDTDADGIVDAWDLDSDGDGVGDVDEGLADSDGDGAYDFRDTDDDGDGIPTATEGLYDTDGDGIPNFRDTDSDEDGFLDGDPLEGLADDDSDGVLNYIDPDSPSVDADGDGVDDAVEIALGTLPDDPDTDDDTIGDGVETNYGSSVDTDGDGAIDALDTDSDDDGVPDASEGAIDTDGDGAADFRDDDDDDDGIATSVEGVADVDLDGVPNHLDLDSDGDGYPDAAEAAADSDPYDASSTPANVHDPVIGSVYDVRNDQGRRVRINWLPSDRDVTGSPLPILSYSIYRRIDVAKAARPGRILVNHATAPGDWDFVLNLPAAGETAYHALAGTLCDSTEAGLCWSVFFVRAHTAVPTTFFDSAPDSGYSIDNLAPSAPRGFAVAYGADNDLTWQPCDNEDFDYFRIYRGDVQGFPADPAHLLHTTVATAWSDDGGYTSFYRISAVDFAGNESEIVAPTATTGVGDPNMTRFTLYPNQPNPFNPQTTIKYDVPVDGLVTLRVYDIRGALVRTLVDADLPRGSHQATWDGRDASGRGMASGSYFARLETQGRVETVRMSLVR